MTMTMTIRMQNSD